MKAVAIEGGTRLGVVNSGNIGENMQNSEAAEHDLFNSLNWMRNVQQPI